MRFFDQVSFLQAHTVVTGSFSVPSRGETVPILHVVGRVTAEPVVSEFDVPGEDRCLVDGCAVSCAETAPARSRSPADLPSAVPVESGDPLPAGCDAVVMVEDLELSDGRFTTVKAARPGQHVRRAGAEVRRGEVILPSGHRIRPDEVGALVACGVEEVRVRALQVSLIPIGQGLVPPGTRPRTGEVIESNTARAAAFLAGRGVGCIPRRAVAGDVGTIAAAVMAATAESDLVLLFGGVSKGPSDGTAGAIGSVGEVLFHGVAMQPGRPTLAGRVNGVPVLALPGYPFAAGVVLRELVAPLLSVWGFPPAVQFPTALVELARPVVSEVGVDEFVPLTLGSVGDRWVAFPRARTPASHLADIGPHAFLHVPGGVEGYETGEVREVRLTTDPDVVGRTLIVAGPGGETVLARFAPHLRSSDLVFEPVGGAAGAAIAMLQSGTCHFTALDEPGGVPRLLCTGDSCGDPRIRAVIGAAGSIGLPVEFIPTG